MPATDPSQLDGVVIGGRYLIEGLPRHTGGFAHIYQAIDQRVVDRRVAVKVLRNKYALDDSWRKRFLGETVSLEQVKSRNVVIVHDRIENDVPTGLDYLIMEWIRGVNLEEFRQSGTDFKIEELLKLAIGITEGVEKIHSKGVGHGDITPKNIMLKEDKIPVIIDFGLSWDILDVDESERQHGGTILYLAPEQFAPHPEQSLNADIYSLGAVLFFLINGAHYFPQLQSEVESFQKLHGSSVGLQDYTRHIGGIWSDFRLQPIKAQMPGKLRAKLNGLLITMLSYNPSNRPSALEVLGELEQIYSAITRNSSQVVFPLEARDYSIIIANYEDGLLADNRHTLTARKHNDNWIFETSNLYLGPQEKVCNGVLLHNDNPIFSGLFEVDQQPFKFYIQPSMIGETVSLEISHGTLRSRTTITLAECEFQHEVKTKKPLQLALLIDGAMSSTEIRTVQDFVTELFNGINARDFSANVTICIYGEYQQHPGNKKNWQMPFNIQFQDFNTLEESWQFIESLKSYEFKGKGYAGSLEFGLLQLRRVLWKPDVAKHLLIIGTSPPHPNGAERARFHLVDFTVEEYRYQEQNVLSHVPHWLHSIHELRGNGINTRGIWIPPTDFDVTGDIRDYIDSVWAEINEDRQTLLESARSRIDSSSILSAIGKTVRPIPMLDNKINFPLLSTWQTG